MVTGTDIGYLQQINNFQPDADEIGRFSSQTNFPLRPQL
jgi:hypothetical protein